MECQQGFEQCSFSLLWSSILGLNLGQVEEVQTVDAEGIDQNFAEMLEEPKKTAWKNWKPMGFLLGKHKENVQWDIYCLGCYCFVAVKMLIQFKFRKSMTIYAIMCFSHICNVSIMKDVTQNALNSGLGILATCPDIIYIKITYECIYIYLYVSTTYIASEIYPPKPL